jgi:WD40 repeat protein
MKIASRIRDHILRALRSPWLAVVVAVAVGGLVWWFCPPRPRVTFQNSKDWAPLAFSPDGSILLADGDQHLGFWDVHSGEEIEQVGRRNTEVYFIGFSPEGDLVSVDSGRVKVRPVPFGVERDTAIGNLSPHSLIVFSADGQHAALRSGDRLEIWDWPRQELFTTFSGRQFDVDDFGFLPDGGTLVIPSEDALNLWDVARGNKGGNSEPIGEIIVRGFGQVAPTYEVMSTFEVSELDLFSPNPLINVRLWRIGRGLGGTMVVLPYGELIRNALSAHFSRDGKMIAITFQRSQGGFWNRVKNLLPWLPIELHTLETVLYDVDTVEPVAVIPNCYDGEFSPDRRSFVARGLDGMIHLWDMPPRKPMRIVVGVGAVAGILSWLVRWCFLRASRRRV